MRQWLISILFTTLALLLGIKPILGVSLHPGLKLETVYTRVAPQSGALGRVYDIDRDPITGHLFVAQHTPAGGNILVIDAENGNFIREIPFFSRALAFADDGTLYFGVSNLLMAKWRRDKDEFRIFASIPKIRSLTITPSGELFAGVSLTGPIGLYENAVLRVDRFNALREPVLTLNEAATATGYQYNALTGVAISSDGAIFAGVENGRLVRKSNNGQFLDINPRAGRLGPSNHVALAINKDDIVFQHDATSGQLFAIHGDGSKVQLLAYGDSLRSVVESLTGIYVEKNSIYVALREQKIFKFSTDNGQNLTSVLAEDLGRTSLAGLVIDALTELPLADVEIQLTSGASTTTGDDGRFTFSDIPAGLYEVQLYKPDSIYRPMAINLDMTEVAMTHIQVGLNPGLPDFLAPGLGVDIVATSQDGSYNSVDVTLDKQGSLYSMNHQAESITKITLDPSSRQRVDSRTLVSGLPSAWWVAVDDELNVYSSNGNAGTVKLPPRTDNNSWLLTVDPNDIRVIRDQDGVNRSISLVTDIDGGTFLANGDLILSSGNGGSQVTGIPETTFQTLVRRKANGEQSIFSHGIDQDGEVLFFNNDLLETDSQNNLLITNKSGNVVRVFADGSAELLWPGNGTGKPEGTGAYTAIADDGKGFIYIRGATDGATDKTIRLISPDGNQLIPVAGGLSQNFGGIIFDPDGKSLFVSDDKVVLRIYSLDERSITENILNPVNVDDPSVSATIIPDNARIITPTHDKKSVEDFVVDYENVQIAWELLKPETVTANDANPNHSGGGSLELNFLTLILLMRIYSKIVTRRTALRSKRTKMSQDGQTRALSHAKFGVSVDHLD